MHKAYETINYIGGRFKNRNNVFRGKGMLLSLLWVEVADQFHSRAMKTGNARALEISKAI